ncbi:hypothetical protein EYF80_049658 [Liparis tanakae]|uniref:Uncharacterized protein n=1 Tax=Liparis tanakae TaxID=230148 RepID=A0A4Z2FHC7_9TELE|nr:hypothetical protein EYF80_049658 [Liparis tanakae]
MFTNPPLCGQVGPVDPALWFCQAKPSAPGGPADARVGPVSRLTDRTVFSRPAGPIGLSRSAKGPSVSNYHDNSKSPKTKRIS